MYLRINIDFFLNFNSKSYIVNFNSKNFDLSDFYMLFLNNFFFNCFQLIPYFINNRKIKIYLFIFLFFE